jgi:hypothetical protein
MGKPAQAIYIFIPAYPRSSALKFWMPHHTWTAVIGSFTVRCGLGVRAAARMWKSARILKQMNADKQE